MNKNIGPVRSYQDVYVAACGADFPDHALGRLHESNCRECRIAAEEAAEPSRRDEIAAGTPLHEIEEMMDSREHKGD